MKKIALLSMVLGSICIAPLHAVYREDFVNIAKITGISAIFSYVWHTCMKPAEDDSKLYRSTYNTISVITPCIIPAALLYKIHTIMRAQRADLCPHSCYLFTKQVEAVVTQILNKVQTDAKKIAGLLTLPSAIGTYAGYKLARYATAAK